MRRVPAAQRDAMASIAHCRPHMQGNGATWRDYVHCAAWCDGVHCANWCDGVHCARCHTPNGVAEHCAISEVAKFPNSESVEIANVQNDWWVLGGVVGGSLGGLWEIKRRLSVFARGSSEGRREARRGVIGGVVGGRKGVVRGSQGGHRASREGVSSRAGVVEGCAHAPTCSHFPALPATRSPVRGEPRAGWTPSQPQARWAPRQLRSARGHAASRWTPSQPASELDTVATQAS